MLQSPAYSAIFKTINSWLLRFVCLLIKYKYYNYCWSKSNFVNIFTNNDTTFYRKRNLLQTIYLSFQEVSIKHFHIQRHSRINIRLLLDKDANALLYLICTRRSVRTKPLISSNMQTLIIVRVLARKYARASLSLSIARN